MTSPIPEPARRLIAASIPTVPHLEALVLASAKPEHSWDASELAHMLYIPLETARGVLLDLVGAQLMVLTDAELLMARYSPTDSALGVAVGQLVEVYTRRVVEVTRLIHAHGGDDAQRLADAFRVRERIDAVDRDTFVVCGHRGRDFAHHAAQLA